MKTSVILAAMLMILVCVGCNDEQAPEPTSAPADPARPVAPSPPAKSPQTLAREALDTALTDARASELKVRENLPPLGDPAKLQAAADSLAGQLDTLVDLATKAKGLGLTVGLADAQQALELFNAVEDELAEESYDVDKVRAVLADIESLLDRVPMP